MAIKSIIRTIVVGCSVIVTGTIFNEGNSSGFFISDAEARRGRPMTPTSVAGVSRRTTRRAIRRSNRYVATLPRSCKTVLVEGTSLQYCGSTYYQAHNDQYVVVIVD